MQQLLCRQMNLLVVALLDRSLTTFIPCDLFTIWPLYGSTVRGLFDLAVKCVCHSCIFRVLGLMIPNFLFVVASDLRDDKLHIFGNQLAFLPCDWFTSFCSCPNLFNEKKLLRRQTRITMDNNKNFKDN